MLLAAAAAEAAKHQWRNRNILNNWTSRAAFSYPPYPCPLFAKFFVAFYFFHISTATQLMRVANQVTRKKKPTRVKRKAPKQPKWQMACFVLPFDSPRLDFFLPPPPPPPPPRNDVSEKRKPFAKRLSCHFTALHCIPCKRGEGCVSHFETLKCQNSCCYIYICWKYSIISWFSCYFLWPSFKLNKKPLIWAASHFMLPTFKLKTNIRLIWIFLGKCCRLSRWLALLALLVTGYLRSRWPHVTHVFSHLCQKS